MRKSNEPLWWAPFSAGMAVDALVIPALVIITGILVPAGLVGEDGGVNFMDLLRHPLARLALFGIIALSFFHAAHRLKFTLIDLGLKDARTAISVICYGGAILGTAVAAAVALGLL